MAAPSAAAFYWFFSKKILLGTYLGGTFYHKEQPLPRTIFMAMAPDQEGPRACSVPRGVQADLPMLASFVPKWINEFSVDR